MIDWRMSLAEFDALPEDNSQLYELREGVFQVFPKAAPLHQLMLVRVSSELDSALPMSGPRFSRQKS
ncbi:hypothetical protein QFW96_27545 [Saccharopolyspora sp. TS4A08]|uniref:Restriction endonuclease domain-containing protein n=1 Tax=Saccharopolyspora ipomoeae TaxID=3042027 RepID=A0ABT6PWM2_9PSEU|nr:hypothetical protein [Saccharopolyspora sp. TS4A08]MDI2032405.1 hypothetical protein [Saccharopolyspora sp. TS4A08]